MKSASGKRPPDEAHGPGKEAIRARQLCLGESRKEGAPLRIQKSAKFHQTFSYVCSNIFQQNITYLLRQIGDIGNKILSKNFKFPEIYQRILLYFQKMIFE